MKDEWCYQVQGKLEIPYRYFAGEFLSRFFVELRDHKKILGVRCPQCAKVFFPPRSICGRCLNSLKEWVELGDTGTLQSFTVVRYSEPIHPLAAPFALGLIKLDGADTSLLHLVGQVEPSSLKAGLRLKAVFKEEREGSILDILYFQPHPGKKEGSR